MVVAKVHQLKRTSRERERERELRGHLTLLMTINIQPLRLKFLDMERAGCKDRLLYRGQSSLKSGIKVPIEEVFDIQVSQCNGQTFIEIQ